MSITGRALHFVFKVADRNLTSKFYRDVLGMQVLRHEEFKEGCEAACNGPYANQWSKTMVGYGPEDNHFVIELTYNYTVDSYELGNDFIGITIRSSEALERAREVDWPIIDDNILEAPGGYKFFIIDEPQPTDTDPVEKVTLASSNLEKSVAYWNGVLDMTVFDQSDANVLLGYSEEEAVLELQDIGQPVSHGEAFGRIAYSCPFDQQKIIESKINSSGHTILKPLTSLDTPGKATVRVIILADPDGHEICFVDDESFRDLSKVDPQAAALLDKSIAEDKSKEQRRGKSGSKASSKLGSVAAEGGEAAPPEEPEKPPEEELEEPPEAE